MMDALAFLGNLGPGELVIIAVIVILLFGSQKIPQLMRSMGSGLKEFKKGLAEGEKEPPVEKAPDPAPSEERHDPS
jgi:sec-independent protein translocase protein TatA